MEHLYDTHFHLDLQKDRSAVIREIEQNQIYTLAVTNLPDLYRKEIREIKSRYIRLALGLHPELVHQYKNQKACLRTSFYFFIRKRQSKNPCKQAK